MLWYSILCVIAGIYLFMRSLGTERSYWWFDAGTCFSILYITLLAGCNILILQGYLAEPTASFSEFLYLSSIIAAVVIIANNKFILHSANFLIYFIAIYGAIVDLKI